LKKDIRSRIYEEWKGFLVCHLPNDGNTSRLPFCRVKPTSRDDLIFEVDSNDAQVHQTGDVQGQLFVVVAVAPSKSTVTGTSTVAEIRATICSTNSRGICSPSSYP
jgi:hypothetical protein